MSFGGDGSLFQVGFTHVNGTVAGTTAVVTDDPRPVAGSFNRATLSVP